jgi:CheY-like chemotaxis protein
VISEEVSAESETNEEVATGNERVLFVDDEVILAEMGKDMLEQLGYHVAVRNSSIKTLQTFQIASDEFDIVITDQTMPEMTGSDLVLKMMQIRPDIPIILCTGYSNLIDVHSAFLDLQQAPPQPFCLST